MKNETINRILNQLGSYEFNSTDEAIDANINGYLDENTHILYNEDGIKELYDDMCFLFDDFVDEYPTLNEYKKYFTVI